MNRLIPAGINRNNGKKDVQDHEYVISDRDSAHIHNLDGGGSMCVVVSGRLSEA